MDVLRIYQDFSVDYVTEGQKHTRPGWVNVACPFCTGNQGYHLGWNTYDDYYQCWRCGWHPPMITLAKLLNIPVGQVTELVRSYGVNRSFLTKKEINKKGFIFPSGTIELEEQQIDYLKLRNFKPKQLVKRWEIKATSPTSKLDNIPYKYRILIPFKWNGQFVSFDTRDTTDKQKDKYKACPIEREAIEHKHIFYCKQEALGSTGICVEGPTDVWRMGFDSFATSGIKHTTKQLNLMAMMFRRVPVLYDDDPQAIIQANKLVSELRMRGVDSWRVPIKGDPGALSQREANELRKYILKTKIVSYERRFVRKRNSN